MRSFKTPAPGLDPETIPTDGASLEVPRPSWLPDLLAAHEILFRLPSGELAELYVMVMPRARWRRHWADRKPEFHTFDVGPLVVAVRLTL